MTDAQLHGLRIRAGQGTAVCMLASTVLEQRRVLATVEGDHFDALLKIHCRTVDELRDAMCF